MKLTINLVTQRPVDAAMVRKIYAVLMVLLVTCLILTVGYMFIVRQRHQRVGSLLTEISKEVTNDQTNDAEQKVLLAESATAARILKRQDFKWSRILNHLEQTGIDGIQVRAIEPDFAKQTLAVHVLAQDESVFRSYLEKLLKYKSFSQVLLLRQENITVKDAVGQSFTAIRCEIRIRGGF